MDQIRGKTTKNRKVEGTGTAFFTRRTTRVYLKTTVTIKSNARKMLTCSRQRKTSVKKCGPKIEKCRIDINATQYLKVAAAGGERRLGAAALPLVLATIVLDDARGPRTLHAEEDEEEEKRS